MNSVLWHGAANGCVDLMSDKRKQKRRDLEAHRRKLRQRNQTAQLLSGAEINIQREVDYITRRAAEHDARCVTLGAFTFFATASGDAWMRDAADGLALCLARDGVSQPVRITETDATAAVEWDRTFSIVGECFTTMEKQTGRVTTVLGYPTQAILAVRNAEESRG
jgi:hypothetical protein